MLCSLLWLSCRTEGRKLLKSFTKDTDCSIMGVKLMLSLFVILMVVCRWRYRPEGNDIHIV